MKKENKLKDRGVIKSRVIGELIDAKTKKVVQREVTENLITDVGENMLAYWTKGDVATKGYVTHASLSDESGAPSETETTESGTNTGPRKTVTSVISASKITSTAEWATTEANYTIRRGYLFTAASGGNLFATTAFGTPFTKTIDYEYKLTWEITYA